MAGVDDFIKRTTGTSRAASGGVATPPPVVAPTAPAESVDDFVHRTTGKAPPQTWAQQQAARQPQAIKSQQERDALHAQAAAGSSGAEIDPNGGYWLNTPRGRQHFPGTPPPPAVPLKIPVPVPVQDAMTKLGNTMELPMTLIGAAQMDWAAGRSLIPGQPPPKNDAQKLMQLSAIYSGDPRIHPDPNTSTAHALRLIGQKQFSIANDLYSTTSIIANKQRAALGDKGAQFLQQHPTLFSALAFGEEFANPANILTGKAAGLLRDTLAPTKLGNWFNRMHDVRQAAYRSPGERAQAAAAQEAREAAEKANRFDVEGATGAERREHHYTTKVTESAAVKAARQAEADRIARTPKLTGPAAQPEQLMLPPGQQFARALAPAQSVTAAGEARLALPGAPPPPIETPTVKTPTQKPRATSVEQARQQLAEIEAAKAKRAGKDYQAVKKRGVTGKPWAVIVPFKDGGYSVEGWHATEDSAKAQVAHLKAGGAEAEDVRNPGDFSKPQPEAAPSTKPAAAPAAPAQPAAKPAVPGAFGGVGTYATYHDPRTMLYYRESVLPYAAAAGELRGAEAVTGPPQSGFYLAPGANGKAVPFPKKIDFSENITRAPGEPRWAAGARTWTSSNFNGLEGYGDTQEAAEADLIARMQHYRIPDRFKTSKFTDEEQQRAIAAFKGATPGRAAAEAPPAQPAEPTTGAKLAKATQPITQPQLETAPERQALTKAKERGTTVPQHLAVPYPEAPLAVSGPSPEQGPFRYVGDELADRAERTTRKMADTSDIDGRAQQIVHDLFKGREGVETTSKLENAVSGVKRSVGAEGGLTRAEQRQMVHVIEGTMPVPDRWAARVARYRASMRQLSADLVKNGIAEPGQIWLDDNYFPRLGSTLDPNVEGVEEGIHNGDQVATRGVRMGTLVKRRLYATLEQAEHMGAPMNPDWDPAQTLENHLRMRLQSIQLESGVRELRDLGLLVPHGRDVPPGWETVLQHSDIAKFGSPTINSGASFPQAIAKMIRDITYRSTSPKADIMLSTPINKWMQIPQWLNWVVSRFETASFLYHTWVNLLPNQLSTIVAESKSPWQAMKALAAYPKELLSVEGATARDYLMKLIKGEGTDLATLAGVTGHYGSDVPEHRMIRPWSDLSGEGGLGSERVQRGRDLWKRFIENTMSRPLYQTFEKRMANATYKALQKGGVSEPKAALLARQTIGEPENMPSMARTWSELFQFPRWRLSTFRLWPWLLAKSPALYMGPQRAGRAYNISRGAYDTSAPPGGTTYQPPLSSSQHMIPDIYQRRDEHGVPQYWAMPHPAGLTLDAMNTLGSALVKGDKTGFFKRGFSLASSLFQPVISTTLPRLVATMFANPGEPGTGTAGFRLFDRDAPKPLPAQDLLSTLAQTAKRYAPVQPNPAGLAEFFGVGTHPQLSSTQWRIQNNLQLHYRQGIRKLRAAAQLQLDQNNPIGAARLTNLADQQYYQLEDLLKKMGLSATP